MKIGDRERESDKNNPNWIPQVGEYYAWRESCTRHGNLIVRRVESFDGKIVKGREPSGMGERRYISDIFKLGGDWEHLFNR